MRALNSRFVLIDINNSFHAANQIPASSLNYIQNSSFITSISSSFRRTRGIPRAIASRKPSPPSIPSPKLRKKADPALPKNGSASDSPSSTSTSSSVADGELEMFLQLLPAEMRSELYKHTEIGELIEVVLDLGRKPLARFPSGDWVISEQVVKHDDLKHAISKVKQFSFCLIVRVLYIF